MKNRRTGIILLMIVMVIGSCASIPKDRYNTQKGAVIGAGAGAGLGAAGAGAGDGVVGAGIGAGTGEGTVHPPQLE